MNILVVKKTDNGVRKLPFDENRLLSFIDRMQTEKTVDLDIEGYKNEALRFVYRHGDNAEIQASEITDHLIRNSDERNSIEETNWDFLTRNIYLSKLLKSASKNRFYNEDDKYGSYVGLQDSLGEKGVYSGNIMKKYSKKELSEAEKLIVPERDQLITYMGLDLLATRYLARDFEKNTFELPQERWLTIALYLMQDEPQNKRMEYVSEAYWALSNLYMTTATPTLANAGKPKSQLSSCFIDTVGDDLRSIYDSNTDIANVSKHGGGVGVYIGNVRSMNSSIRGVKGASGGVVPWIKQLNNTAISVDQLGQRKGAIAIYLDIFHKDIESFLDLKLNNGDERMRAHDIFPGVCIPDLFMEVLEKRGEWCLFDPHEVYTVKGWRLQDFYDEKIGSGSFREKYYELINDDRIHKKTVNSIEIMKRIIKSQYETGTPFMFYRDTVNRMNPNKHAGMVYCSNLCTEIMQNMSATYIREEAFNGDEIVIYKKSGDFVVCNLSSINLSRAVIAEEQKPGTLERLINIQVRMLDNVIDVNELPVQQATITNKKYRAIGLGVSGWHHLLALKGIHWDSSEAVEYSDNLFEKIAYHTISASSDLSKEKGAYSLFEGSDWCTGDYFDIRQYNDEKWISLKKKVQESGIRNSYLMAVAPTGTTSDIAGTTASGDPVYKPFYFSEKRDFRRPIAAPDLSIETLEFYGSSAFQLDQFASINQTAARQRHVDQGISFNFYIPSSMNVKVLLEMHKSAWRSGLKSTYYVRTNDLQIEECEWCSS